MFVLCRYQAAAMPRADGKQLNARPVRGPSSTTSARASPHHLSHAHTTRSDDKLSRPPPPRLCPSLLTSLLTCRAHCQSGLPRLFRTRLLVRPPLCLVGAVLGFGRKEAATVKTLSRYGSSLSTLLLLASAPGDSGALYI